MFLVLVQDDDERGSATVAVRRTREAADARARELAWEAVAKAKAHGYPTACVRIEQGDEAGHSSPAYCVGSGPNAEDYCIESYWFRYCDDHD